MKQPYMHTRTPMRVLCLFFTVLVLCAVLVLAVSAQDPVKTELSTVSAVIADGIDLRIGATVSTADRAKDVRVEYTFCDKTETVTVVSDAEGAFSLIVPVGPAQMQQRISVQMYVDGEAVYAEPKVSSVKDYCVGVLADSNSSQALRTLVSDMLLYGAASMKYVGDAEGAVALTQGLTLTGTPYTAPVRTVKTYGGDEFKTVRVILNNRLNLAAEDENGTRTCVTGIRFLDAFDAQSITDGEGQTLLYSVASYVAKMDADATVGPIVRALWSLCLSADAYVGHDYGYVASGTTHDRVCARCADVSATGIVHSYGKKAERVQGDGVCADTYVYGVCVCGDERLERRLASCKPHTFVGQDTGLTSTHAGTLTYVCTGCGASYGVDVLTADTFSSASTHLALNWPTSAATSEKSFSNGQLVLTGAFNKINFTNNVFLQVSYAGAMADVKHAVVGYDIRMPAAGIPEAGLGTQIKIGGTWTGGVMLSVKPNGDIYLGDTTEKIGQLSSSVMTSVTLDMRINAAGDEMAYTVYLDGRAVGSSTKPVRGTPDFSNTGTYVQLNVPVNSYGEADAEAGRGFIVDNVYMANGLPDFPTGGDVPLEPTSHTLVYRDLGSTHERYCERCGVSETVDAHAYDTVAREEKYGAGVCATVAVYRGCSVCGAVEETPILVANDEASHEYEFSASLSRLTATSSHNNGKHTPPYGTLVYQCKHCDAKYTVDAVSDQTFDRSGCPCGTLAWNTTADSAATKAYENGRLYLFGPMNKQNFSNNVYLQMQYLSGRNVPALTDGKHIVFGFDIGMPEAGIPEAGLAVNLKIGSWTGNSLLKVHYDGEIWLGNDTERVGALSSTRMTNVVLDIRINAAGDTANYSVYLDGILVGSGANPVTSTVDFTDVNSYIQLNIPTNGYDKEASAARGVILDNCFVSNAVPAFDPSPSQLHTKHEWDSENVRVDGDNLVFFCPVCAMSRTVPSVVNYDDFGAVGDGVTDDGAAIRAAHEFANKWNLPVTATSGKTYRIGMLEREIPVMTDVDWCGATILIDDSGIRYDDELHREVWVFHVKGQEFSRPAVPAGMTLAKGQTNIGMTFDRACMLKIINKNERIYARNNTSGNGSAGEYKHEYILVDKNGNVDPTTPIQYDYATVSEILRYEIDDAPITVGGGNIITRVPDPKAQDANYENHYCFFYRGLKITRSNATVANIAHRIEGEQMVGIDRDGDGKVTTGSSTASVYNADKPYGVPYHGFFYFEGVYNATFRDSMMQGHQAYNFFNESGQRNEMGSYDLTGRGCIRWNLLRLSQYENPNSDATRSEVITNRTMYHGVMGSNFCRNIVMEGCYLDRFDSHQGMHNATITNSTLGFGILVIGGGELYIENVNRPSGSSFILLREDYNSMFDGNIIVKNCTAGESMDCLIRGSWQEHNLGLPNYIVHSVTVEGITVSKKPFYVYKITNATGDSLTNTTNPLYAPVSVSISGFNSTQSAHTSMILCPYDQRGAFSTTSKSGDVRNAYAWEK